METGSRNEKVIELAFTGKVEILHSSEWILVGI
jgi:hypothetical protein